MDFYARQTAKRWHSAILLIAFVLVLLGLGILIQFVVTAASLALGQGGSFAHPSKPAIAMIVIVWLAMFAGSLFRLMDVNAGGAVLARRFGAVHASDRSRHEKEQQLLNIVAEVSIASSTAQPDVFVLRGEDSINAFVLGNRRSRPVVVVTEGALEAFDRDQLQAVVAHEFGHIVNGDLPLNMRLLVVMGGLMAIEEVGRLLIGENARESVSPAVIVGIVVCALGKFGSVSGQLISAAFSRQREYLADATAVQFTRHPFALASALDVISDSDHRPALHGVYARELTHLCFQSGRARRWLGKLMNTHPEISRRITAIEPHFDVKKRKAAKRRKLSSSAASGLSATASPLGLAPIGDIPFVPNSTELALGAEPETSMVSMTLSDRIVLMLPDASICMAALFALFIHENTRQRQEYFSALKFSFNDEFTNKVKSVMQHLPDELAKDQLGIITHASRLLVERTSVEHRQKIVLKLEQLLNVNGNYHLMDYARVQLVRRKLAVEFPLVSAIANESHSPARARKAKSFDSMGREFALLLSLMVETSGASSEDLDKQFRRVLKCYTLDAYPRRTANETGIVKELEAAFQTLYMQPKSIRHAFVQHCIEIMQSDGFIMPTERALLDLFAASLGCEELIAA